MSDPYATALHGANTSLALDNSTNNAKHKAEEPIGTKADKTNTPAEGARATDQGGITAVAKMTNIEPS